MREKFARYNLELEEVLIGTPASSAGDQKIEQILTQLRARQIAEEQIERAGVDIVPHIVVGGSGGNGTGMAGGSSLMEGLLAMLLSERMSTTVNGNSSTARPEATALREQIMKQLMAAQPKEAPTLPATVPTTPLQPNGKN